MAPNRRPLAPVATMSSIASHLAADITLQAFRGASAFQSMLAGMEGVRARREARRQAGVDTVADLSLRLHEALDGEDAAVQTARLLHDENARLRAELAAARELVARARRAVLAAA